MIHRMIRLSRYRMSVSIAGLLICSSLFSQEFSPASGPADMDRMLQSLVFTGWSEIKPGRVHYIRVELTDREKEVLSQFGNTAPEYAILSIGLPSDYDSDKVYPILFTSVTGNIYAPNAYSIRNYYRSTQKTGWIVVSIDGDHWPKRDTIVWRIGMMEVAVRYMNERWMLFEEMPVAYAGFSGGAKISVYLSYFSILLGKTPAGLFLSGCNQAPVKEAAKMTELDENAVRGIPVFFSMGEDDRIATLSDSRKVTQTMARAGFSRQQIDVHPGGHHLESFHLLEALQFFESFFPEKKEEPSD